MRRIVTAMAGLYIVAGGAAEAASLCHCCGSDTVAACSSACAPVKSAPGQCVATLDPAGRTEIGPGKNPLYDIPLQNVWLGGIGPDGLEAFRRLLERARRGAENDRARALSDHRKGVISAETAATLAKRYDDAIVNYFLGIQAYRIAQGR
jgi:hypothetical protein